LGFMGISNYMEIGRRVSSVKKKGKLGGKKKERKKDGWTC